MNLMKLFMWTSVLACMVLASTVLTCSPAMAKDSPATLKLKARTHELREDIIPITDKVYTSVGHTVSTVSMIEGDKALIIIDTGFALPPEKRINNGIAPAMYPFGKPGEKRQKQPWPWRCPGHDCRDGVECHRS